jgi:HAD superfamily phosphatase (TIGR01681 family)
MCVIVVVDSVMYTPKGIVAFDLDMTLTEQHTEGVFSSEGNPEKILEYVYYVSRDQYTDDDNVKGRLNAHRIVRLFHDLWSRGYVVAIVSRGLRTSVVDFMHSLSAVCSKETVLPSGQILRPQAPFHESTMFRIYGADDERSIMDPKWQEQDEDETDAWARKKVEHLKSMCRLYCVRKKNVYFFDDTRENIEEAIANGFIHAIQRTDDQKTLDQFLRSVRPSISGE